MVNFSEKRIKFNKSFKKIVKFLKKSFKKELNLN